MQFRLLCLQPLNCLKPFATNRFLKDYYDFVKVNISPMASTGTYGVRGSLITLKLSYKISTYILLLLIEFFNYLELKCIPY